MALPNTSAVTFSIRVDTSKTNVKSNEAMNFGETLILSGLSEKETQNNRDGVPGLQDVPIIQYFFSQKVTTEFQKSVLILLTPRKPEFVHTNQKSSKNQPGEEDNKVLSELKSRYSDWFLPYPNWASVFHHMQENKLYREFRTGDVSLEKWEHQETRGSRIKKVLEFLYY